MNNPYEVLGVRQGASQDEIKAAYKTLVKKYHPDKYQNNPLADLAEEKLQEINEAYDTLTKVGAQGSAQSGFSNNAYGGGSSYGNSGGSNTNVNATYQQVRVALDRGDLRTAEQLLINSPNRDGEWYFLSGILSYKKGWFDDALSNIAEARRHDPNNFEYARAYQTLMNRNSMYQQRSGSQGYGKNDDCMKMLQCYICTDCLCPCF